MVKSGWNMVKYGEVIGAELHGRIFVPRWDDTMLNFLYGDGEIVMQWNNMVNCGCNDTDDTFYDGDIMEKWLYDCEIIKIIDDDMTWWWIHNSMLNFMKYCDRRQPWNAGCVWNRGIPTNKWLYHAIWSLTRKSGGFSLNLQTVCQFWSWWCLLWQSQSHIFIGSWLSGCRATNRAVRSMPIPASTFRVWVQIGGPQRDGCRIICFSLGTWKNLVQCLLEVVGSCCSNSDSTNIHKQSKLHVELHIHKPWLFLILHSHRALQMHMIRCVLLQPRNKCEQETIELP